MVEISFYIITNVVILNSACLQGFVGNDWWCSPYPSSFEGDGLLYVKVVGRAADFYRLYVTTARQKLR